MSHNHDAWTLGEEVYRIGSWREYLASVGTVKPMEAPLDPSRTALIIVDVQRKMPTAAEREGTKGTRGGADNGKS